MILRIIKIVDALRTLAWQRDRNRQPTVLPSTFRLRLWLPDYPQLNHFSDACATFAQQILSLLQETMDVGLSHHARFDEIKRALSRCLPEHGVQVARCFGSVELEESAKLQENLLRVELAEGLLRKVKLPQIKDDETSRLIKAMLDA